MRFRNLKNYLWDHPLLRVLRPRRNSNRRIRIRTLARSELFWCSLGTLETKRRPWFGFRTGSPRNRTGRRLLCCRSIFLGRCGWRRFHRPACSFGEINFVNKVGLNTLNRTYFNLLFNFAGGPSCGEVSSVLIGAYFFSGFDLRGPSSLDGYSFLCCVINAY